MEANCKRLPKKTKNWIQLLFIICYHHYICCCSIRVEALSTIIHSFIIIYYEPLIRSEFGLMTSAIHTATFINHETLQFKHNNHRKIPRISVRNNESMNWNGLFFTSILIWSCGGQSVWAMAIRLIRTLALWMPEHNVIYDLLWWLVSLSRVDAYTNSVLSLALTIEIEDCIIQFIERRIILLGFDSFTVYICGLTNEHQR